MRYARNFAHGYGLVWNPGGARVEGYTNPLWVLYMSLVHLLPIAASKVSLAVQVTAAVLLALNLVFVRRIALALSNGSRAVAFGALALTASYLPINNWSLQGMEVSVLVVLITVCLWLAIRGIDTARFTPQRRGNGWRARHGIGEDELVILHVSRLVREKRLDTLTAALKALNFQHRAMIVGDGPDRSFAEQELPHAVFTGFLAGDELADAYAASDIFVFPSDSESFGNVTLEAMASGLACVCADATGSRSLVVDGETGFLADASDAPGFAAHITRLAKDPALRDRMGQAGRARALTYSWDETLARMLGYYRAILGAPA